MPWVRFDDSMPDHRKIRDLTNAAFRLHVSAICWCNRHLTDGRIGHKDLKHVSHIRSPATYAAELVNIGLWKPTENGWVIHDYLEFQPSAEKIRAERKAAAERQERYREARKQQERNGLNNGVTDGVTGQDIKGWPDLKIAADSSQNEITKWSHRAQTSGNDLTLPVGNPSLSNRTNRSKPQVSEVRNGVSHTYPTPHPPQPTSPDDPFGSSDWKTWADHLPPSVTALRPKPQREGSRDEPDHDWTDPGNGKW